MPKPAVHGFQAQVILLQRMAKPRLFGDVRADDLVDDPPGHLHPPALKAPRLPVFQRDDGLGFNRAPEGVRVKQRLPRELMAQFVHFQVF